MGEYLKSGRQAIRLLYYLIIGLSITKALSNLLVVNDLFTMPTTEHTLLFVIYFTFIIRFFLGAYRVLTYDVELESRHAKIVIDMIGFISQALTFFIYSLSFLNFDVTHWVLILICSIDLVWLVVLLIIYRKPDSTTIQWIVHNVLMIVFLPLNLYIWKELNFLFIVSIIAFVTDLGFNREFYFSIKIFTGLKIFITYLGEGEKNLDVDKIAILKNDIISSGHIPYIPSSLLMHQPNDNFNDVDMKWLENCDALYLVSSTNNAELLNSIGNRKIKMYSNINELPKVKDRKIFNI